MGRGFLLQKGLARLVNSRDTRKVQALEPDIPLFQILVLSFASNLIWAAYRTPQSLH